MNCAQAASWRQCCWRSKQLSFLRHSGTEVTLENTAHCFRNRLQVLRNSHLTYRLSKLKTITILSNPPLNLRINTGETFGLLPVLMYSLSNSHRCHAGNSSRRGGQGPLCRHLCQLCDQVLDFLIMWWDKDKTPRGMTSTRFRKASRTPVPLRDKNHVNWKNSLCHDQTHKTKVLRRTRPCRKYTHKNAGCDLRSNLW